MKQKQLSLAPRKKKKKNTTWRIIPVSKWLVTPIYKPWKGHLEVVPQPDPQGTTTITMVWPTFSIHWDRILQVGPFLYINWVASKPTLPPPNTKCSERWHWWWWPMLPMRFCGLTPFWRKLQYRSRSPTRWSLGILRLDSMPGRSEPLTNSPVVQMVVILLWFQSVRIESPF